jgi:hypothetical protein
MPTHFYNHWIFRLAQGHTPDMSRVLLVNEPARLALALCREYADPVDAMEAGSIAAEALNRREQLTRCCPSTN